MAKTFLILKTSVVSAVFPQVETGLDLRVLQGEQEVAQGVLEAQTGAKSFIFIYFYVYVFLVFQCFFFPPGVSRIFLRLSRFFQVF